MNGGAIIVFLTLLGHVWDKDKVIPQESMQSLVAALVWWIAGTFSVLLSYSAIFVTNCFSTYNWHRSSNLSFAVTVLCGLSSLICFLIGSLKAVDAFKLMTTLLKTK